MLCFCFTFYFYSTESTEDDSRERDAVHETNAGGDFTDDQNHLGLEIIPSPPLWKSLCQQTFALVSWKNF
jgi:hypothetical protein